MYFNIYAHCVFVLSIWFVIKCCSCNTEKIGTLTTTTKQQQRQQQHRTYFSRIFFGKVRVGLQEHKGLFNYPFKVLCSTQNPMRIEIRFTSVIVYRLLACAVDSNSNMYFMLTFDYVNNNHLNIVDSVLNIYESTCWSTDMTTYLKQRKR